MVWVVADATIEGCETGSSFRQALYFKRVGFRLHDTMIWMKQGCPSVGSETRYGAIFEYMFVLAKQEPKTIHLIKDHKNITCAGTEITGRQRKRTGTMQPVRRAGGIHPLYSRRTNVWKIPCGAPITKDKIALNHPAVFPERLVNDHIVSWSGRDDVVYDPFMGSGTTAKMAIINHRNFIGSEINPRYCKLASKRVHSARQSFLVDLNR